MKVKQFIKDVWQLFRLHENAIDALSVNIPKTDAIEKLQEVDKAYKVNKKNGLCRVYLLIDDDCLLHRVRGWHTVRKMHMDLAQNQTHLINIEEMGIKDFLLEIREEGRINLADRVI